MTSEQLIKRLEEKRETAMHMKWAAATHGKTSRKHYWDGQMDAISEVLDLLR